MYIPCFINIIYLNNVFKNEDRTIIRDSFDFANQNSRFEKEQISFFRLSLGVGDSKPVMGEQPAKFVDIPSISFDARYKFVVGGSVGYAEEEF